MIQAIDTNLFPTWLVENVFTNLVYNQAAPVAGDILWASREFAFRKRANQKHINTAIFPFLSMFRSSPISRVPEGQSTYLSEGMKYVGETAQKKQLQALRVEYSYNCIYYDTKVSNILLYQKALMFAIWRPVILSTTIHDLSIEFAVYLNSTDEANSYHTEEEFNRGAVQEFAFTIDVEALLVRGTDLTKIINEVVLNMYGYQTTELADELPDGSFPNYFLEPETVNIV